MTFEAPQALLLAIPLALLVFKLGRIPAPASYLRWALVPIVTLALARPVFDRGGDQIDLVLVVDRSRSMPQGSDAAAEEILGYAESRRAAGQRVGIVTFGREARVERAPSSDARFSGFQRPVDGEASDLASALHAAEQLMPESRSARVLVLSDGRATGGDPMAAARRLALRGVPIDFRLLARQEAKADVAVLDLEAPTSLTSGEAFHLTATVRAASPGTAAYTLVRNGSPIGRGKLELAGGEQRVTFRDRLEKPGLVDYRLEVEGAGDTVPENDTGRAVVRVGGPQRVLLMRADGKPGALAQTLRADGLQVQVVAPTFASLDALEGVSAVVLENVPAQALGEPAMRVLDLFVRERGGGLVVTGGPQSFGQGGYFRSALEDLLPVSMELRKEQRRTPVALVVAMDRSGSMSMTTPEGRQKIAVAAEGVVGALTLLAEGDEAAVWVVDERAHEIVPLTPIEKGLDLGKVATIQSEGGGIYIYEALEAAGLQAMQSDKPVKHVLLFADADDSEEPRDYVKLIGDLRAKGVTVSVIGLGTPADHDAALLVDVAQRGGGRMYFAETAYALPRLFAQETIEIARAAYVSDPTPLTVSGDLAMLGPVQAVLSQAPTVGGYNVTYLRPGAGVAYRTGDDNKAPALSLWQRGLGRVAAFAAEVDGPKAAPLVSWPAYRALFGKVVRWSLAPPESQEALVRVRRDGHDLAVTVEVAPGQELAAGGASVTLLPGDGIGKLREEALRPEGDGRLAAHFTLDASGSYHPVVKLGGKVFKGPPATLPYAPEYEPQPPARGRELLAAMARLTGGLERLSVDGVFDRVPGGPGRFPLAPLLVALALGLMVGEVALRRFFFRWQRRAKPAAPDRRRETKADPATHVIDAGQGRDAKPPPGQPEPEPAAPPESPPQPEDVADALAAARDRARQRMK
ncbi:MAG TPA: VWA domain-containing protein [Myxococcales bacterium]